MPVPGTDACAKQHIIVTAIAVEVIRLCSGSLHHLRITCFMFPDLELQELVDGRERLRVSALNTNPAAARRGLTGVLDICCKTFSYPPRPVESGRVPASEFRNSPLRTY